MPQSATSLTSWAKAIRKALDQAGCDSAALFREAGLDLAALGDPNARYPLAATTRLWQLAVAATGNSAFGLAVASQVNQTTFHALGYSVIASSTLKEVFERVERYFRLVTDAAELSFGLKGEHYEFVLHVDPNRSQPAWEAIDAFASVNVRMCRALYGRGLSPLRIHLRRPVPADVVAFERVFRAPIEFNAAENQMTFERAAFERPLEGANPELARHNDEIALRYLARFDKDNVVARVRGQLVELLPLGEPSQEKVAGALHMSERNLQRKLADEGTTYKELLNRTRSELALSYMRDPHYTVSEITYLLGFSDASSFTRAFRRWTGKSPSAYRETMSSGAR